MQVGRRPSWPAPSAFVAGGGEAVGGVVLRYSPQSRVFVPQGRDGRWQSRAPERLAQQERLAQAGQGHQRPDGAPVVLSHRPVTGAVGPVVLG